MNVGRLLLRGVVGPLFIGHGTQKLKGWFGGPGIEGTTGMMESLDLHPPRRHAIAAGAAETAGGALLAAGLLTPLASSPHKDPRAPQNLVPIGGLERELRRRLGDQQLLYRGLRAAALNAPTSSTPGG